MLDGCRKPWARVAVTAMGVASAAGLGCDAFWDGLLAGCAQPVSAQSVFGPMAPEIPLSAIPEAALGRLCPRGFDTPPPPTGRTSRLCLAAARQACGEIEGPEGNAQTGLYIGTATGDGEQVEEIVQNGSLAGSTPGDVLLRITDHRITRFLSKSLGMDGETRTFCGACAAGNQAIAFAVDRVREGIVDRAVAGGGDAICLATLAGMWRANILSDDGCRPFDKSRKGTMLGDGAAFLVLESRHRAMARGAPVLAEVIGHGSSCDAHHIIAPHPDGMTLAMGKALADAGIAPEEVDAVCAHGTGTTANDTNESQALHRIFGVAIEKMPVFAIKSMTGHALGGAAALEAVACCRAIQTGIVPPTAQYAAPDKTCRLPGLSNAPRHCRCRIVMNNSFGFGGVNVVTLFRAHEENA